jgi:hypothetical protein
MCGRKVKLETLGVRKTGRIIVACLNSICSVPFVNALINTEDILGFNAV